MTNIKDLAPLAERLNAATDALNNSLKEAEGKLNALGLGIEVWVPMDDPAGAFRRELGYGRCGNRWALLVRNRICEHKTEATPLLGASRSIRITAVHVLPQVFDALRAEAQQVLKQLFWAGLESRERDAVAVHPVTTSSSEVPS